MPRTKRVLSESGCYHVTMRGAGKRSLFEDDRDREEFLKRLRIMVDDGMKLYAWCLMDNHVHLLIDAGDQEIGAALHRLCTSYALFFNGRHAHVGPVFQGRFASFPVESDAHLLETVRYIHLNPKEAGVASPGTYRWSSYAEYLGEAGLCDTSRVLDMLGGPGSFAAFHDTDDHIAFVDLTGYRRRLSDAEARALARSVAGEDLSDSIALSGKDERDACLRKLYGMGLSTRQLERLTGIGRSVIRRVCAESGRG